jgi:molybdopterin converting factor small subunit
MVSNVTREDLIKIKVGTILDLKEILGQREQELLIPRGSTMKDLIGSMIGTYGERLSTFICGSGGQGGQAGERVFPRVRIMVNGQDIAFLGDMATVLQEGDEVLILPMVAGG